MWHLTPSLDILILASTVAPAELIRVMTSFGLGQANRLRLGQAAQGGVLVAYVGVTALALIALRPSRSALGIPQSPRGAALYAAAIGVGVLAFGAEYLLGSMPVLAMGRQPQLRVSLAGNSATIPYLISILLVAVVEEVLYRGIWLDLLRGSLHVGTAYAVLACAAGYASGHLFFGGMALAQKFVSGAGFSLLMVATGSLAAPIAAHVSLNVIVFALARVQRTPI